MSILAKLAEALKSLHVPAPQFDPSVYGDPLAAQVDWAPLARGGSNFRTHKGVLVGPDRFEFRATAGLLVFAAVFALLGGGMPLFFLVPMLNADTDPSPAKYLILLFPGLFLAASLFIWKYLGRPAVFDKREGWFWRGNTSPAEDPSVSTDKHACALTDIRALQIIPERISSKNGSYTSWELNLILADASRRNVTDHGSETALFEDARTLATFLAVPLWNQHDGFRQASSTAP
jgi:hypothetical protein